MNICSPQYSENAEEYTRQPLFPSFGISYDFVMNCEYREEYKDKCIRLLEDAQSGKLDDLLDEAYPDDKRAEKHRWKKSYVKELLKDNCKFYLNYGNKQ